LQVVGVIGLGLAAEVAAGGAAVGRGERAIGGERADDIGYGVAHLRALAVVEFGVGGTFGA